MAVIFHSVLGLRQVEQEAAERFRSLGFDVALPDLYEGERTESIEEGFELMTRIGWPLICERALQAVTKLPDTTVLVGFSMGAGVIASLWRDRPRTKAVLLFHALAEIPKNVRAGLKLQLHIAETDRFVSLEQTRLWTALAVREGVSIESFTYPQCGHFFTDVMSADCSAVASELMWIRVLDFLAQL
jgi:dienelactone hydrolase